MESILKKLPFGFFKRKTASSLATRFENSQLEGDSMNQVKAGASSQFGQFMPQPTATCGSLPPQ